MDKQRAPWPTRPHPQALVGMRSNYAEITRLCAECQSLIDCHDKIAVLSEVHSNLRKTLQVGWGGGGGPTLFQSCPVALVDEDGVVWALPAAHVGWCMRAARTGSRLTGRLPPG